MNEKLLELREVVTKLVPMLAGRGIRVTQMGTRAYVKTDVKTLQPLLVNIPMIPENADESFIAAIQGFIDHEVAHVLHTDWKFYGGENLTENDLRDPKVQSFITTHNIVEDTMIERLMAITFPGSKHNIHKLREHFIAKITKPALAKAKTPKQRFVYLLVPIMRALSGHTEFQEFLDAEKIWDEDIVKAFVDQIPEETLKRLKVVKTTEGTLEIARTIHDILFPPKISNPSMAEALNGEEDKECEDGEQSDKSEADGESQDKPEKEAGEGDGDGERDHTKGEEESDKPTPSEDEGSEGDAEGEGAGGDDDSDDDGEDDETSSAGGGEAGDDDDEGEFTGADPEFTENVEDDRKATPDDIREGNEKNDGDPGGRGSDPGRSMFDFDEDAFESQDVSGAISEKISEDVARELTRSGEYMPFTLDFDRIEPPRVPAKMNSGYIQRLQDEVATMIGPMQKEIERIMASQSFVLRIPGQRSGRLHSPSLFRVQQGDPRVFTQREEHRSKDTAVTLLIDNSGSMRGTKMHLAMIAGYALSATLEKVKIAHEVIGFTTGDYYSTPKEMQEAMSKSVSHDFDRYIPIIMPVFKAFNERIDSTVKERMAWAAYDQVGLQGNYDGECLLYAAARLAPRPERRKVLIVLSDGQPAAGPNGHSHLKGVVDMMPKKFGIECIGIGIQDSSVRHYYDKHVVLHKADQLPGQVMTELKKLLSV